MKRRTMLASLLAVGAAAAIRGGSKRLSVIADETGDTIADWIAFAKRHGIENVELRAVLRDGKSLMIDSLPVAELREMARRLSGEGIKVSFLNSALLKFTLPGTTPVLKEDWYEDLYRRTGKTPESLYASRTDDLKRAIETAHIFGTPLLRSFSYWRVADPGALYPRLIALFEEMGETCARGNCRLLVETEYATNVATSKEIAGLMAKLPSKSIGINWDPQNSLELEAAPFPDGYALLPKKRIENVQVKAAGLFGPKKLPWGDIMRTMDADGYQGLFGLETHHGHGPDNYAMSGRCMKALLGMVS